MKKLTIVSMGKTTGNAIAQQIRSLIGKHIIVEAVLMSEVSKTNMKCDLVLFTSEFTARLALKRYEGNTPFLIADRVINHKNIERVISLPVGMEVLFVNDGENSAFEAIEQLVELGLDHVKYYPFYPGCTYYPTLETAITPGEVPLVPNFVNNIIDIGTRILDIRTIYEIISRLDIRETLRESLVTRYIKDIVRISKSIDDSRKSAKESEKLLETIVDSVESGIAYVNSLGRIVRVNSKFQSIFEKKQKDILNKKLSKVIDSIDILSNENKTLITEIEGREVLIDIHQINLEDNLGHLVTVDYTDKISKLDHKIRRNYEKRITRKLYTFEDYLSVNREVKEMIKKAERFSKTDATILIQGENGTGKEIIAQAVHMNSFRRKNAFIPVNIAAITPNLLESELFGYEEGAFTGAKKGGKVGLFEIANGGTIFIDEIGDAPINFQVKLLRVLQEKRIRRVGALEEIPIDVRVIAATNKNLLNLIDKGQFREDLFFRLNILPLKTIPLRRRRDDILYLFMHFVGIYFRREKLKSLDELFEDIVVEFLQNYRWRGNVRELMNLVEYLSFIYEGKRFELSSLPYYMLEDTQNSERIILDGNELWVLREIEKNSGIGRSSLAQLAQKQNVNLGEGKIRGIMKKLEDKKLIDYKKGKRGCIISERGIRVLESYE
ncbi:sigma-54 interaction domain-containing protein [Paramaledivibacter caminithermalis]|jgi:PAS domain S-box-containing protein|uniref:PAS domain S-box-containing protein n=1 Tax=Paramaledivibacter caminithermalis (strain DSM 15212 / CIP 107654 / DViRD3) TaxID=1121301 RepID=A0A1M6MWS3_PARC5|nr:sigma 54-interacting transcriptional regulator [Paramaledivibacter caminithermalis]SHJ87935.1 PAS domain S-box-containing protein [Paramaledivibacter caminithermalis DSM 15212]